METSKPSFKKSSPLPTSKPSPSPVPTVETDPIIDCAMQKECGGNSVKMKFSECISKVCCNVGDDVFKTLPREECSKIGEEQFRQRMEKLKEDNQKIIDSYMDNLTTYSAPTESNNALPAEKNFEFENTSCKQDSVDTYNSSKTQTTNVYAQLNTIDSSSYRQAMDKIESDYNSNLEKCDYYFPIN